VKKNSWCDLCYTLVEGSRRETKGDEEKGMMAVAEEKGTTMEGKMLREAERRR
jgi:hypothetical protein